MTILPMSALYELSSELTYVPNVVYVVFWEVDPETLNVF